MNNFGVYQPPSGIENIQRSTQINSVNNLNNPRRGFDEIIGQGWGGNIPGSSPQSPSPSPSPSSSPLPPGNLSPGQISTAMETKTCSNPCITLNFVYFDDLVWSEQQQDWAYPGFWRRESFCWGSVPGETGPNDEEFGWISFGANMGADLVSMVKGSDAASNYFFTVDDATRASCFGAPPSPSPSPSLGGNAAPPPPPGKNMCGCDCNTIATIIEERLANQNKPIKDHIDQRTIEQLKTINKMLQGMKIDLDLQPVIDRLNEVEANLWNGPKSGG